MFPEMNEVPEMKSIPCPLFLSLALSLSLYHQRSQQYRAIRWLVGLFTECSLSSTGGFVSGRVILFLVYTKKASRR